MRGHAGCLSESSVGACGDLPDGSIALLMMERRGVLPRERCRRAAWNARGLSARTEAPTACTINGSNC